MSYVEVGSAGLPTFKESLEWDLLCELHCLLAQPLDGG